MAESFHLIYVEKKMITSTFILLVVFLGLSYSAFSTNLGINGTLKVDKYEEKIYWALQDNDTTHMYGSTSSTYADPPSGRTFTVATS